MSQAPPIARRLLSVEEAAAYIDMSVHTVYTMVSQRRIPFTKVGRSVKFEMTRLDEWIKQRSFMPKQEKAC